MNENRVNLLMNAARGIILSLIICFVGIAQAQPHHAAQRVAQERRLMQVRQEAPLGLVVGVAHIVARLDALAGHGAAQRHE